ncbi:5964_t:CDS:2 [Dentiscutata heterogama]|uniref:5964_t:CDS:1 n=1 Tax=Dentiscutata heterogama TaxID=1316150 RepID=A0ACA9K2D1_9GLOM|nr:5964_t:CDS:2 [Dentiscutata heterogama]
MLSVQKNATKKNAKAINSFFAFKTILLNLLKQIGIGEFAARIFAEFAGEIWDNFEQLKPRYRCLADEINRKDDKNTIDDGSWANNRKKYVNGSQYPTMISVFGITSCEALSPDTKLRFEKILKKHNLNESQIRKLFENEKFWKPDIDYWEQLQKNKDNVKYKKNSFNRTILKKNDVKSSIDNRKSNQRRIAPRVVNKGEERKQNINPGVSELRSISDTSCFFEHHVKIPGNEILGSISDFGFSKYIEERKFIMSSSYSEKIVK